MAAIPGIPGAGDLIHAGKRLYQAKEALSEGPDGARQHFQQATAGLAQCVSVEEAWIAAATDPATVEALKTVRNLDRELQDNLARSNKDLGRGAKSGFKHGTISKLNYGFNTDKSVREHHDRIQPAREAANMRIALMNANKTEARFDQQDTTEQKHFTELKTISMDLMRQLSNVATRQDLLTLQHQISQLRVSPVMSTHLPGTGTTTCPPPSTTQPAAQAVVRSPFAIIRSCAQAVVETSAAGDLNPTPKNASDIVKMLFAMAMATAYHVLQEGRASSSTLPATPQEIVHACFISCIVLRLLSSLRQVPRLINDLSDNKITLHTALGEELRISELYWKSHHTLHGYLQYRFEDKAGRDWVDRRDYRFLIGGTSGVVIEESKWPVVLSRHTQLTMAFLIVNAQRCHKCAAVLQVRGNNEKSCLQCKKSFSSISEPSALSDARAAPPQRPSARGSPNAGSLRTATSSMEAARFVSSVEEMAKFVHVLLLDIVRIPAYHSRNSGRRTTSSSDERTRHTATLDKGTRLAEQTLRDYGRLAQEQYEAIDHEIPQRTAQMSRTRAQPSLAQECPICMDSCDNPRVFACGHGVCKQCFIALCTHALAKQPDAEPRCPTCHMKLIGTSRPADVRKSSMDANPLHRNRRSFDVRASADAVQSDSASYQMILETESGPMVVPIMTDLLQASKVVDEKSRRNAGAQSQRESKQQYVARTVVGLKEESDDNFYISDGRQDKTPWNPLDATTPLIGWTEQHSLSDKNWTSFESQGYSTKQPRQTIQQHMAALQHETRMREGEALQSDLDAFRKRNTWRGHNLKDLGLVPTKLQSTEAPVDLSSPWEEADLQPELPILSEHQADLGRVSRVDSVIIDEAYDRGPAPGAKTMAPIILISPDTDMQDSATREANSSEGAAASSSSQGSIQTAQASSDEPQRPVFYRSDPPGKGVGAARGADVSEDSRRQRDNSYISDGAHDPDFVVPLPQKTRDEDSSTDPGSHRSSQPSRAAAVIEFEDWMLNRASPPEHHVESR